MSSSLNNVKTESIKKESVLQSASSQKAFEFYSSKYDNLLEFLDSILDGMENPEPGLHSWLSKMKSLNFDLFLSILEKQLADNDVDQIIENFAREEGFSLDNIKGEDLHKIKRYITLFQSML
jgi:hypothetical protein